MLTKIAVEPGHAALDEPQASAELQFVAGGLVKRQPGVLIHYTEHPLLARAEWRKRGYRVLGSEEVELGPEGLAGLLEDLEKL